MEQKILDLIDEEILAEDIKKALELVEEDHMMIPILDLETIYQTCTLIRKYYNDHEKICIPKEYVQTLVCCIHDIGKLIRNQSDIAEDINILPVPKNILYGIPELVGVLKDIHFPESDTDLISVPKEFVKQSMKIMVDLEQVISHQKI